MDLIQHIKMAIHLNFNIQYIHCYHVGYSSYFQLFHLIYFHFYQNHKLNLIDQ